MPEGPRGLAALLVEAADSTWRFNGDAIRSVWNTKTDGRPFLMGTHVDDEREEALIILVEEQLIGRYAAQASVESIWQDVAAVNAFLEDNGFEVEIPLTWDEVYAEVANPDFWESLWPSPPLRECGPLNVGGAKVTVIFLEDLARYMKF